MSVIYESGNGAGRRGVLDVEAAARDVHKRIEEREKFFKFVDKHAKGVDLRAGGPVSFASLKDLM